MKRLLRNVTRVVLLMVLGALGYVATASPVAHAGGPSITATSESNGIFLNGSGFTDGAPVRLEVFSQNLSLMVAGPTYVTPYRNGQSDGTFIQFMPTAGRGYQGSAYVLADQAGWPTVGASDWTQPSHLPYVYNAGASFYVASASTNAMVVSGSGFDPNHRVTIYVNNYQAHCSQSFTVSALPLGVGAGTFFTRLPNNGQPASFCPGPMTITAAEVGSNQPWQLHQAGAQVLVSN